MLFASTRSRLLLISILLLIAAVALLVARPELGKSWLANRYAARAEALTKSGGHEAARISAIKALKLDPNCVRALNALLPEIAGRDPREEMFLRSRLADLNPGDLSNLRILAMLGINFERYLVAETAIDALQKWASQTEVLELRARLSAAQGDFIGAKKQAQLLLQQAPSNPAGRLILALAQIQGGNSAEWPKAEAELQELAKVEPLRLEAQRGLRHSALLRGDWARAAEFSKPIVSDPSARFDDWLNQAQIDFQLKPESLAESLAQLTTQAGSNVQALAIIASWLRKNGQADRVAPWADACKALQEQPVVAQMIRADTLIEQKAWAQLSSFLEPLHWGNLEFQRQALLARSAREQYSGYTKYWNESTTAALKAPASARELAELISTWDGWGEQQEEFLWQMEQKDPTNIRWALSKLSGYYQRLKNTRGLLRVAEELYRTYPSSEPIQNNLAYYSLLLNTNTARSFRIMDTLYLAHPEAPEIVSTFSLAMIRKGNYKQAVEVLKKLPPQALSKHDVAPYYAAALAGNGQTEEAHKLREGIDQTDLLPEAKELLQFQ